MADLLTGSQTTAPHVTGIVHPGKMQVSELWQGVSISGRKNFLPCLWKIYVMGVEAKPL